MSCAILRPPICFPLFQYSFSFPNQRSRNSKRSISPAVKMRMVGLTGGIASGKSAISNLFKSHRIPVVDADLVTGDVLKKYTGGYNNVVAAFGEDILRDYGEVDRQKLGKIVFSHPAKRQLLNRRALPFWYPSPFFDLNSSPLYLLQSH